MSWVKLDDGFYRHPKARAAGKDGRALFLAGLCHAAANLTDGVLPKTSIPLVAAEAEVKPSVARRLVDVGLWHDRGDHYEIHQYLDRNPTRAKVEKERERWRRNKRGSAPDSTAEPGEEPGEDSTVESRRPRPVPVPSPPGSRPSSSSESTDREPVADDDDPVSRAALQVARRRMARQRDRGVTITKPGAYLTSAQADVLVELGHQMRSHLDANPETTVAELVDLVEPPTLYEREAAVR